MARTQHHITRIDIETSEKYPRRHPTHGWQVRIRRDGNRLSKFFADARHDGREEALEAAMRYRDALLEKLPAPDGRPRRAWSNTGVAGLSVREKKEANGGKTYVQLNWVDEAGKRHGASYSVEKWGLRRALWDGCLRLHHERQAAGRPVEAPHEMFARAQEPFMNAIRAEIAAEQGAEGTPLPADGAARRTDGQATDRQATPANGRKTPRPLTPEEELKHEEQALQHLASTLFGK